MDQIIIQHLNNCLDFLSLKNFLIPFIVNKGLKVQNIRVFFNKEILEDGIIINIKREGFWILYDENGNKISEGNYKNGKREGYWIVWYKNGNKYSEKFWKDGAEYKQQSHCNRRRVFAL